MQSIPTAKATPRRQLSSECNALQLNNGKATSLMGLADNQINTNSYLSNSLLFRLLFKLLNPCPLSLIVSIIINFTIANSEPYSKWMYVCQFILIFVLIIVKEVYFDMMRSKADQKVNLSKFIMKDSKLYRDGEELTDITWGQIQQGDILYLEKGEKAPADLLLLDTQHIEDREAIVYVDARSITGKVTVERKKACYLTQVTSRSAVKRNWDKYRREYLTGKLKYQPSNSNMQDFVGYLKLVKDPKTSLLTFQNFISRESVIKTCWVYALVLNGGMNCKIMRHIGERNRNHKFFQNYIDRIFAVCLIVNILLALSFTLFSIHSAPFIQLLAYHVMQFSIVLPHFLFLGNGLLLLYFSFKNNIQAEIINYSSIINLGSIDYAVMAYNGVLSSGKMNADQIITSSSLYDFRMENQDNVPRGSRRNGSLSGSTRKGSRPLMSIYNSSIIESAFSPAPLQRSGSQFDNYFLDDETRPDPNHRVNTGLHTSVVQAFPMHLQPLRISKQKLRKNLMNEQEQAVELMKAFALCHQAILKSQDSQDIKFQANSKVYSEEVLLRMVNSIGVHVSCQIDARTKKQDGLKIKIQDQFRKNQEFARQWFFSRKQNNFQVERKLYSVVVRQQGKDRRQIYCKGSPEDMLDRLKDKEMRKNLLENRINSFKNSKAEILIYAKRQMSKNEYELYENQYTKLKMSSSVSQKDIEDFSTKFEQDLEFVCMVGLSSEKSEAAKQITQYLTAKGIKMCVFANNLAEVQSLRSLLETEISHKVKNNQSETDYVELQSKNVEEITYNLNAITRKLTYQKDYQFSLVLGTECWALLKVHSSLMQHFLFAAYYASNLLTYGFTSQQKAQITEKLKRSYNRVHTLMSIGSSYSDLLFQNYSDVSLIIGSVDREKVLSDIPSDIRAPNILSLRKIIELGLWVSKAYDYMVNLSVYRATLLVSIAFILQITVFVLQGTSYSLDPILIFLYVVVYGALQTIFIIKLEQRKGKQICNDYQIKDKKANLKFWTSIIEGAAHGATIGFVVLLTLPNARLAGGKLFPVQAIHFSIYLLMISVSIFRHFVSGECSKMAVIVLAVISYPLLLGSPWLVTLFFKFFVRTAFQMGMIWTSYDSVFMMINAFIFCLACSLFISETRKKGVMSILLEHFLKRKKENVVHSRQLLEKDINYVQLVKHLFLDEQNIEESIQQLVGAQFDTNELKIDSLLEIKKTEHRIKNQFNNVGPNLGRFELTLSIVTLCFVISVIHGSFARNIPVKDQIPLLLGIPLLIITLIWLFKTGEHLGRKYYQYSSVCVALICLALIIYQITCLHYENHFLLTCLIFLILTQLMGVRLCLLLFLTTACFITGATAVSINTVQAYAKKVPLQIILMGLCGVVNIAVLYGSTFDSRKNFILRQQIEMQTNQTNDIWTILVPEFVRNFFSEAGDEGGQYKQKNVAILFCYVCNFDSIIEEEGRNVVRLLDNLYREFDKLCSSFAVQKIETVGYTYMAATGIKKIENQIENQMVKRNKIERLLGMAQQMLEKTKMFKWGVKKNKDLQIKIGIHVGEVVVGVIGKHKKQFSLIGTNVNATSRHGSTGKVGSITLSKQARSELHHFPDEAFVKRDVYMKGLCKKPEDTIPVYTFKIEEANRRTNGSSSSRLKFKKLVMKVIRSLRIQQENSEQQEQLLNNFMLLEEQNNIAFHSNNQSNRDLKRRSTCQGLENNFNKIEEMKNRQDQIKCYSTFLQFSHEKARRYFSEAFPSKTEDQLQKLVMKEREIEDAYSDYLEKNRRNRDKLLIIVLFFLNIALLIANLILQEYSPAQIGLRVTNLLFLVLLFFLSRLIHSHNFVSWIFIGVFTYLLFVQKIDQITSSTNLSSEFSSYYCMMIITLFTAISGMRFLHSVVMAILIFLLQVIVVSIKGTVEIDSIYMLFYVVLILIRKYVFQKESIINFRQGQKTAQISKQLSKIVSELLPKHAYEKLKTQNFQNRLELTDFFEQCTILFADIKGFTQFSNKPENREEPQNVVRMLRSLFEQFDVLCTDNNVYKLYTIGDCYVVLGFTNCYDRNPKKEAENVVNFAFEMIKMIEKVKREKPQLSCLNMRIGVHTGTIIGGIVGTEIVRYDIYGSDVVVANKFEETGMVGKVHISEQTKKLLDQLEKKPYSENNIQPSQRVQVKRLNVSYGGYLIKRGNLS